VVLDPPQSLFEHLEVPFVVLGVDDDVVDVDQDVFDSIHDPFREPLK
jgi:hypothetical protein